MVLRAPASNLPAAAILLGSALVLAGCLHRPPLARFEQATPVAVVVLLDKKDGTHLSDLPPEVAAALAHELERRNLTPEALPAQQLQPLGQNRNSKTRSELLANAMGPHRLFLLVELKAEFFGQFEGGYKWNVDGQLTISSTDALSEATTATLGVPTFLEQDAEGTSEALVQASNAIADRAGVLLDDHFAGRIPIATPPTDSVGPHP